MQGNQGRRAQAIMAAAAAALLLIGAAGCGGSGSDSSSDGAAKTTQPNASDQADDSGEGDDGGQDTGAAEDLPDPCELVPIEKASEILGGEAAEPDSTSSDAGTSSRACSWQTQASIDEPTLDGAGHILTLSIIGPVGEMSVTDLFEASEATATEDADVDGCEKAFWMGGMLSALQDGVYLTGTAGLADDSAGAKDSTTDLIAAACASLS